MKRALSISFFLWSACVGTETGNPPFAPGVGGDTGTPMGIVPALSIEGAWLSIDDLELAPDCSGEGTIFVSDPIALDLNGARPIEAEPVIEEGDYCALRFERVVWTDDLPSALTDFTLAIDASFGASTPVHIRSERTGSVALVAETPFAMAPDEGALLVFIDESLLFNTIRFADAARQADGSIEISSTSNAAMLDTIEAQLPGALFLYGDADANGTLSAAERAAGPLAVGR